MTCMQYEKTMRPLLCSETQQQNKHAALPQTQQSKSRGPWITSQPHPAVLNYSLRVVQPRSFFLAQAPVQDKVLQVRERREDESQRDEDQDRGPAHGVFRRVVLPEELGADDAGQVG